MAIDYDNASKQEPSPTHERHLSRSDIRLGVTAVSGVAGTATAIIGAVTVSLPVVMAAAGLMGVAFGASCLVRDDRKE